MRLFFINLPSLGFLALAGYMVHLHHDGWGWCVFGAIVCAATETVTTKRDGK